MKKNLTKKLMLSVLTLAFAVVSLGASTFAWFTLSGSAKLDQFSANVTGGYGLDVTVTKVGDAPAATAVWRSGRLPLDDLKAVIGTQAKFDAVTPSLAATAVAPFANLEGQTKVTVDESKKDIFEANVNYIAFDLHFRITDPTSVTKNLELYLDSLSLTGSTPNTWTADIAYDLEEGNTVQPNTGVKYSIVDSARFAVVKSNVSTIYENAAEALNEGKIVAGNNTEGFSNYGAVSYYNNKLGKTAENDIEHTTEYTTQPLEGFAKTEKVQNLFTFTPGAEGTADDIVTITILVWCEGWDAECINAIFNQTLAVDMQFALYDDKGRI